MPDDLHIDERVEWHWGAGTGVGEITGKITRRFTSEVTQTIDATEVERNAAEDGPVHLIEQENGQRVLKPSTEST